MDVNSDFSDLLQAFNDERVDYLVVGGHAIAVHDEPRFTKVLDVWIEPTPQSAERTIRALVRFGAPLADVKASDFAKEDVVFQIGVAPLRIDILTSIDGVAFSDAWPDRTSAFYGDVCVHVIGAAALIKNKVATGRPQDMLDAERLRARLHADT